MGAPPHKLFFWSLRYALATMVHKWWFLVAYFKSGGGIPFWRVLFHDLSKFSPSELPHYGRIFFGDKKHHGFDAAWLHHQNHNPHHWEYWIQRAQGQAPGKPLPMPRTYVREMVMDWMAASKSYTGSWDMGGWLSQNLGEILSSVHKQTRMIIREELARVGYFITEGGSRHWPSGGSRKKNTSD